MHVAPNSGGLPASPKQGVGYFWRPEEEALIRSLMQKAERERKKLSYAQVARTLEATYSMRAHGLAPRAVRAVQWRVGILRGQYHKNGKKMGKSDAKGEDEEGDEGSEDAEEAMSEAQDNGFGYVEAWRSPGKRRHSSSYPSYAESGSDDVYYSPPPKIPRPSTSIKSRASHDSDSDDEATSDEEWRNEPTYARTVGVFWVRSDQSKLLQLAEEMADELQVDTLPIVAWAKIGASLRIKRSADACRKMWRKLEQEHAEGKGYFAPSGQKAGEGGTKLRGEGDHCRGPPEQRPSPGELLALMEPPKECRRSPSAPSSPRSSPRRPAPFP